MQVERNLFRDDREELNRVGLERDRILDALLRRPCRQVRRVAQDRDNACDEAELVAAGKPPAFEDDVAAVLAGVALRPVCRREQVVGVQERVDLEPDELCGRVAQQLLDGGRARADDAVLVDLEHERVGGVGDEPAGLLLFVDLRLGAGEREGGGRALERKRGLECRFGCRAAAQAHRCGAEQDHQGESRESHAHRGDGRCGGGCD